MAWHKPAALQRAIRLAARRGAGLFGLLLALRIGGEMAPAIIGRHRHGLAALHAARIQGQQQNQERRVFHGPNVGKDDKMAIGRRVRGVPATAP